MRLDTLYINGNIYTMKRENDRCTAVGVKEGRIAFVGSDEEAKCHTSEVIVDLQGNSMLPGFTDTHIHLAGVCMHDRAVNLEKAACFDDVIHLCRTKAQGLEAGGFLYCVNLNEKNLIEKRLPNRFDLDRADLDVPVVIVRCCMHVYMVNSKAHEQIDSSELLEEIKKEHPSDFDRAAAEMEGGIYKEKASRLASELVSERFWEAADRERALKALLERLSAQGITTVHTFSSKTWGYEEKMKEYQAITSSRSPGVRVHIFYDCMEEAKAWIGQGDEFVKGGGFKLVIDGSLGAGTAAIKEAYADDGDSVGVLWLTAEELTEKIEEAYRNHIPAAMHAIGDRAFEMALDAVEQVCMNLGYPESKRWFRIIHAQVLDGNLMDRAAGLPIILDIQPTFICNDWVWAEKKLGRARLEYAYPWKSLAERGVLLTGGSDAPSEPISPILGIYAAVNRMNYEGCPRGGWLPKERLSTYEAVCLYTKNAAFASGEEGVKGTIEIGKLADLVILKEDPFSCEALNLNQLTVVKTIVNGALVYQKSTEEVGVGEVI